MSFSEVCCNWLLSSAWFLKANFQEMSHGKFEFKICLVEISGEVFIYYDVIEGIYFENMGFLKTISYLDRISKFMCIFQWLTCDGWLCLQIVVPEVFSFQFFWSIVYYNQIVRIERKQSHLNFTCKLFPIPPIQNYITVYFSVALDEGC